MPPEGRLASSCPRWSSTHQLFSNSVRIKIEMLAYILESIQPTLVGGPKPFLSFAKEPLSTRAWVSTIAIPRREGVL